MIMIIAKILIIIGFSTLINIAIKFIKFIQENILKGSKKHMSTSVTLDEFLNYDRDRGIMRQVVYKVDGDFVGDINGENVTVILMGDGDIKGNVNCKDGDVVLIKGNINGDVKANKVICPTHENKYVENELVCQTCKYYSTISSSDIIFRCNKLEVSMPVVANDICSFYERKKW